MFGSLVRTITNDQISLTGMHFEPDLSVLDLVVVHVHGSLGNFYGNLFIDYFADFYTQQGIGFLTTNNRGYGVEGINERFEKCAIDIEAWLRFAWARGYRRVILQGHSLGALKAVHFAANLHVESLSLDGLVLLAPFDIISFYCKNDLSARQARLAAAREVASGDPAEVMPRIFWDAWPISAGTFLDLIGEETCADVFPFRRGILSGTALELSNLPTFAAIGSADFAAYPSPAGCVEQLNALAQVTAALIDQAPHNFAGKETEMLQHLRDWMQQRNVTSAI